LGIVGIGGGSLNIGRIWGWALSNNTFSIITWASFLIFSQNELGHLG